MARLFFGLQPDPAICDGIDAWRRNYLPPLDHPVQTSNLHITLAFLGEVKSQAINHLAEQAGNIIAPCLWFDLDQLGYWSKPGILWLGPARVPNELITLASDLTRVRKRMNLASDHNAFVPHLTLARRCEVPPSAGIKAPRFEVCLDHFTLFESRRGKQGLIYEPLFDFSLGEDADPGSE